MWLAFIPTGQRYSRCTGFPLVPGPPGPSQPQARLCILIPLPRLLSPRLFCCPTRHSCFSLASSLRILPTLGMFTVFFFDRVEPLSSSVPAGTGSKLMVSQRPRGGKAGDWPEFLSLDPWEGVFTAKGSTCCWPGFSRSRNSEQWL